MILEIIRWRIDLKRTLFQIRMRFAIMKAKNRAKLYNKKHMVIVFAGRPRVYAKSDLKDLIKRRVIFKKHTTVEKLEKMAYFITT
jgi:hypothetical protein